MDRLAGIFFEVEAQQAGFGTAALTIECEHAAPGERLIVLRDLIALRQVGIEVVLAGRNGTAD